ncbi:hypothetical protein PT974_10686 [Cladobotryum mycophilum]|uniref:Uncharacterized protein n=1 Tax=Cladobotryum mycophilum TaxID=491253 RepID=A0ABR0SAJ9_9HYPO
MATLTMDEQRFVLAEIIKSSSVDVHKLACFIKSNSVIPDWYDMQLPSGRSMNQCIKFAQSLSLPTPSNQQHPVSHNEHAVQNITEYSRYPMVTTSPVSHHSGLPSIAPGHHEILPRPANGVDEIRTPLSPAPKSPARKRGRPSRSDLARQTLQPRYPTPIAPRPPPAAPGSNAPPPRVILPAINRAFEPHTSAPLVHPPPSLANGARSKKRRRPNSPPPTPIVNKTSPPPLPPPASPPPPAVMPIPENDSDGRENSDQSNTKTPTPESSS